MRISVESSLISELEYDGIDEITFYFKKYYVDELTYIGFEVNYFETMMQQKSIGKFYLHFIKQNFKLKNSNFMPEGQKRKTKNKSSDEKRFIKLRIDVTKLKKEWFFQGEKGVYADATLMLLPDGEVDKHGDLGMIVQDVPKDVYTKDKSVKGPILGNGTEFDWNSVSEGQSGTELKKINEDVYDDLPF